MLDPNLPGRKDGVVCVSEEGALIIWAAYKANFPSVSQTMERREERGGICWLSEIESWKKSGHLPSDFEYTQYVVSD